MQKEKYIVVLGAGESGTGAAILARLQGYDVFVSDSGPIAEQYLKELRHYEIPYEEKKHSELKILIASEVIKSPGIPDNAPIVQKLVRKNIPILSDIEFAAMYTPAKMICITGTNGKSTTTMLIYHILKHAGLKVGLAGNIGQSFAKQVATEAYDYYVLEISSFMLDHMYKFKADIAILLNITADHLDRYQYRMADYVDSKFRIIQNQTNQDFFIYCADDQEILQGLRKHTLQASALPFSIREKLHEGACLEGDNLTIHISHKKKTFTMSIHELALQGKHNIYNSMASAIVAKILEIQDKKIRESLKNFTNIAHRMEHVAQISGIHFINDSKATNINSTWYALESISTPVVLIMGGVDKGNDYTILKELVHNKVKAIVCLGKDSQPIHDAFEGDVEVIVNAFSANDATQIAYHLAKKGDTVLLSPACASFDLFENYADRGNQFKEAVKKL